MRLPRIARPAPTRTRALARTVVVGVALVVGVNAWLCARTREEGRPFLWRAERPGAPVVWLFGTIHVPDSRVHALAPDVRRAFDAATHVVTEIPLDLESQLGVAQQVLLPADTRLTAILGEARFARLVGLVQAVLADEAPSLSAMVVPALDRLRPWAAMAQVSMLEYLPEALGGRPSLDARLFEDARRAGKRVSALETVAEQAAVFDAFSREEQIALFDAALALAEASRERGQSPARDLVNLYLAGDAERLAAIPREMAPADGALARKVEEVLLRERNDRMIERFERLRAVHPGDEFFVAVGTLHLVGPGSLPELLKAHGYRVERVASLVP